MSGHEQVMVVFTDWLELRQGLMTDAEPILETIRNDAFFVDRPTAEVSPQYRQIIPYVVLQHGSDFFLLTRTPKQTEARLHHKLSLGVGGHINLGHSLMDGLKKELEEEVHVEDPYELTFAGILNDETTEVGRVHLGAVYLLRASSPRVTVRETEKMSGRWTPRSELPEHREAMESWSQIVLDELIGGMREEG